MTEPTEDWQKRIEAGLPFQPTADELVAGYPPPDTPNPVTGYPGSGYQQQPGYPQVAGPVYGTPGSGPGHPPLGQSQPPGFLPPTPTQQFAAVPGYGYMAADAAAPFGRDPVTGEPLSDKSKVTAGLLQMLLPFLGVCGVGRLYVGSTAIGLVQLLGFWFGFLAMFLLVGFLIVPAVWIWSFVDGILMLAGNVRDAQGRKLRS